MRSRFTLKATCVVALATAAPLCAGAQITTFSSRPTFNAAVSPTTVETFGPSAHLSFNPAVLNSLTNTNGINPGDIKAGVTYKRDLGGGPTSLMFNIDSGGNFVGGWLNGFHGTNIDNPLEVAFDGPVKAFGFDTSSQMGSEFKITILYGGSAYVDQTFSIDTSVFPSPMQFYGFASGNQDITGFKLSGNGTKMFGIDNFAFTDIGTTGGGTTPEPGVLAMTLGAGVAGIVMIRRRK